MFHSAVETKLAVASEFVERFLNVGVQFIPEIVMFFGSLSPGLKSLFVFAELLVSAAQAIMDFSIPHGCRSSDALVVGKLERFLIISDGVFNPARF